MTRKTQRSFLSGLSHGTGHFYCPYNNDGAAAAKQRLETAMQIQLNGKRTPVANDTTIGDLIREKSLDPTTVVVEHNLTVIATDDWDHVRLKENDTLEVLRFVGGG
ncbi:MAG: sulfur carrier protein ThiS [Desulfosarcina sp.]|jgi:thiamine biosynthesis protein ThiS